MPIRLVAGRYELRELLGEGGMGVVYRAVDTRTGGFVAIKTMRDVSDPRTVEMFRKEWCVLARLSHPNIVDIRDVDEIEENGERKPCFIMPLLPGITLATLIKDGSRRLTIEKTVGILCQVCNGLEAAHKEGLIHRDLKPSNIFVMEDGTAKIIDFGLVYSAEAKSVTGYKGTWQYMAPEQTEGKTPTVASDIFSLGVVAYETLTARKPFARSGVEGTIEAIRHTNPPAISEINPRVTQLLSKVIHKAIAKRPMHRYASAREFAETLQKAVLNQTIERFETARILPRIERARKAFAKDDPAFASEILTELEAEGNVDPEISLLRAQIEEAVKQKKIQQLLEGVQTRVEQDEIPLALDKLREILELDPQNAEALALRRRIEAQRSSEQISNWIKLARQHLQLQDFVEARQAVREVLNIRYDDSDAVQLLAEIEVREKEAKKARADKEMLYGSALRAYQGGEISAALSKLEQILEVSRRIPGGAIPERDAVYQSFYNRVRTERDSIDKGYEEGRRFLNEKQFQKALEVCDDMLGRYPNSAQFQALKLKVEQSARQELSAYIAEIGKETDAEPDLNRRVNILEEACRRYPNEVQFQQSLRLCREQRDLVHSISTKARQYEEQSQFADAIGQWKILRNIHPQYPGIDIEIGQLERRREQQIQEEKKARFIEQIDQAIDNSAYARALQIAGDALAEFPDDSELVVLEKIAREGLDRTRVAERLFEEARKLRAAGKFEEATEILQHALKLDERNSGLRNALVSLLVERASALLEKDWRSAEPLAQAALELDGNHPAAKRLSTFIAEAKRKDFVTRCVAQVRELQGEGEIPAALSRLEEGLSQYPDEARLMQHRASLQNSVQKKSAKLPQPEVPAAALSQTLPNTSGNAQTGLSRLFDNRTEVFPSPSLNSVIETAEPPSRQQEAGANDVKRSAAQETNRAEPVPASAPASGHESRAAIGSQPTTKSKGAPRNAPKLWICSFAAAVVIISAAAWIHSRRTETNSSGPRVDHPIPALVSVPVTISPSDAAVTIDGSPQTSKTLNLEPGKTYDITASRLGYKPVTRKGIKAVASGWQFVLEPEPIHVQVLTAERSGSITLDGREIWKLEQGDMLDFAIPADIAQHTLAARNGTGELFNLPFKTAPGQPVKIAALNTRELLASSSLGNEVTLFSGNPGKSFLELPGRDLAEMNREGERVNLAGLDADGTVASISSSSGRQSLPIVHGNAPTLVLSLKSNPNLGSVTISTPVLDGKLFVDGRELRTRKPGLWHFPANPGAHTIRLVANGYADEVRTIQVVKGQETNQAIELGLASGALTVNGGTTGADVLVDNVGIGSIGASGSLQARVAPGRHEIAVQKAGFESVELQRNFAPGQTVTLEAKDVTLKPFGTINFLIQPSNAAVTYRRTDQTEAQDVSASGSVKVKAGTYEISATASGFVPRTKELTVSSGEVATAELRLAAIVMPTPPVREKPTPEFFASPDEIQEQLNKWFTGKTSKFLALKPASTYNVVFLAPDLMPTRHKPRHFEWHVAAGPNTEVDYELDAQQLTRKVKTDGKTVRSSGKVRAAQGLSAYEVVITTQSHVIRITRRDGSMLDEYLDADNNWSRAAVAIKGDAFFVLR